MKETFSGHPIRRTSDLLLGRVSIPGATYFITMCETHRQPELLALPVQQMVKQVLDDLHTQSDATLVAATMMPDHTHLLFTLGRRLSLARLVGKFKAHTKEALAAAGMTWQENFYEHRVRDEDGLEPYARYIFLNPYRAGRISLQECWPCWWRWGTIRFGFEEAVAEAGHVPPEWLDDEDPPGTRDF